MKGGFWRLKAHENPDMYSCCVFFILILKDNLAESVKVTWTNGLMLLKNVTTYSEITLCINHVDVEHF